MEHGACSEPTRENETSFLHRKEFDGRLFFPFGVVRDDIWVHGLLLYGSPAEAKEYACEIEYTGQDGSGLTRLLLEGKVTSVDTGIKSAIEDGEKFGISMDDLFSKFVGPDAIEAELEFDVKFNIMYTKASPRNVRNK